MPITPTSSVDPTTMTNNWGTGVNNANNAAKLVNKYLKPRRLFNADPTGAQQAYQSGVNNAIQQNTYATGMRNANTDQAAANMQQYGGNNWMTAGTSKKYKYAAKAASLANAINTVSASIASMPRGKGPNNIARMTAWATQMGAYKGKITG
jgi:hypothetical protein